MTARKLIDWDAEPRLGVLPDVELAAIYGVSKSAVFAARRARGLPSPVKAGWRKGSGTKGPGTEYYRERIKAKNARYQQILRDRRAAEQRAREQQAREQKAVAVARVREVIACCLWGDT